MSFQSEKLVVFSSLLDISDEKVALFRNVY